MLLIELLKSPIFAKAEIIAGHAGLSVKDVSSINIMDAPDIVTFLKQGDLLLTNGYILKDRQENMIDFIVGMHSKGCAGLAIKTKRFSMSIPQEVLEEADRLQFPIIELSLVETTLGELFQQSISLMLENKTHELHYALTIHKQFSDMIMQGNGLERIVDKLADIMGAPVLLFNVKHQVTAMSEHFTNEPLAKLPSLAADAMTAMPTRTTAVSLCLPHISMPTHRHIELFPIHTYRHDGCLLVFSASYPLSSLTSLALEQAAHVIGLEMTKKQAVKERSRRYKNEFFSDLIEGYISTEQEVLHRGGKYGLHAEATSLLIIAKPDSLLEERRMSEPSAEERLNAERDARYELLKAEFAKLDVPFVIFAKNDVFGLLVRQPMEGWNESAFIKQLERSAERLYASDMISFSFGIGNPFTSMLDMGLSYKEAQKALQSGYQLNKRRFVQSYQTLDISRLLRMLPHEELRLFYDEAFKDLFNKEDNDQNELLRTLRAFYDNHCQIIDTAKALFVHRNTVIYRLDKCEKLTGRKLKDPLESFRFRVAFAIEPMLKPSAVQEKRETI
ncbi:PucR family transcriptional regulator [Paenibacillus sinopodophylli]|uniref:PucR family transcriptional regulator n=1 Tax=Paenibacillus sinopodophylli TaxID=1837342 RepID=UPI0014869E0A|nr:PucR family transcriptional regulator [Paenibacillus sinopodophylli]